MSDRVRWLDVLRGVAILGILPANVALFAWPLSVSTEPAWFTGGALREWIAWLLTRAVFDYKFITLFSLLFGVGIVILRGRIEARGGSFAGVALRRFFLLGVIGMLHVVLLWFGDILSIYAAAALIVCWASVWQPRTLKWMGGVLLALPALALFVFLPLSWLLAGIPEVADALLAETGADFVPGSATGSWPEFLAALGHYGPGLEIEVHREGDWTRRMGLRLVNWLFAAIATAIYIGWRIIGLFLLGMAFAKDGTFLAWRDHLPWFRSVLKLGLVTGIPLQLSACFLQAAGDGLPAYVGAELLLYLGSLSLSAAYLSGVVLLVHHRPDARWLARLEAVGRLALSNYLLQSVLCVSVVAAFGLFGAVDRATLWLLVLAVWAIQLAVSPPWLERFGTGPVEWLWRTAAHGRAAARAGPVPVRPVAGGASGAPCDPGSTS